MTAAAGVTGWVLAASGGLALVGALRLLWMRAAALRRCCHELRGPLGAVRLAMELEARRGGVTRGRARAIELELERASLAVEDLMLTCAGPLLPGRVSGLRSVQRGVSRPREYVELPQLVADCVEAARPLAAVRRAQLQVRWAGPPAHVFGDRRRLAQALGNLIANALEHGRTPVEVVGRAPDGAVRIEVTDGGNGLDAPVAELIRRGRRGRGRRGHGLAIAAAVAEAHGGRLAAAPSSQGARLVLELPGWQLEVATGDA